MLCENLHPAFFVIRNEWHDKLKDVQDNAGVRNLALQLKQHLRPLPKMQVIIHLVRQKMKAIRYVPPHALNTIMEFIGAYSTKTIFQTTDFSKYNASSSTDQYRYTFSHDLRDSGPMVCLQTIVMLKNLKGKAWTAVSRGWKSIAFKSSKLVPVRGLIVNTRKIQFPPLNMISKRIGFCQSIC